MSYVEVGCLFTDSYEAVISALTDRIETMRGEFEEEYHSLRDRLVSEMNNRTSGTGKVCF